MTFSWIIKKIYDHSIDPIVTGFVDAEYTTTSYVMSEATNILTRNTSEACYLREALNKGIIITFKEPIIITKYMLQTTAKRRYLKGWKIEVSNDGISYMKIDEREENFCFENITNGNFIDCGVLTNRAFSIPVTTIKNLRLIMTKQDSCGTYNLELTGFDVFGTLSNHNIYCTNQLSQHMIHPTILLFTLSHISI